MLKLVIILGYVAFSTGTFEYGSDLEITGGSDADIQDYPYQLSLSWMSNYFCSAVLISPKWALTSALCISRTAAEEITVMGNSSSFDVDSGVLVNVSRIIVHPQFDYTMFYYDLSILELSTPLDCTNCKPIALGSTRPELGQIGTITGWGANVVLGEYNATLQVAQVPVVNETECYETYYVTGRPLMLDNVFCAGSLVDNGTDICSTGDWGLPIVMDGLLTGILSFGYGCGRPFPGVYTDLAQFRSWINETTGI